MGLALWTLTVLLGTQLGGASAQATYTQKCSARVRDNSPLFLQRDSGGADITTGLQLEHYAPTGNPYDSMSEAVMNCKSQCGNYKADGTDFNSCAFLQVYGADGADAGKFKCELFLLKSNGNFIEYKNQMSILEAHLAWQTLGTGQTVRICNALPPDGCNTDSSCDSSVGVHLRIVSTAETTTVPTTTPAPGPSICGLTQFENRTRPYCARPEAWAVKADGMVTTMKERQDMVRNTDASSVSCQPYVSHYKSVEFCIQDLIRRNFVYKDHVKTSMNEACGFYYFGACMRHFDIIEGMTGDGRAASTCCQDYQYYYQNDMPATEKLAFKNAANDACRGILKEDEFKEGSVLWKIHKHGPRCEIDVDGADLKSDARRADESPFHLLIASFALTYLLSAITFG